MKRTEIKNNIIGSMDGATLSKVNNSVELEKLDEQLRRTEMLSFYEKNTLAQ
jgi:hypothetical protein